MQWRPISMQELREIIAHELGHCPDELRTYFDSVAFEPTKWQQSPYGDIGGGFWAIASDEGRVLWYNDIEGGFNVSAFSDWGTIPLDQYWCAQDELKGAVAALRDGPIG